MEEPRPAAAETDTWTVRRILDWTKGYLADNGSDAPRLEAEILLAHAWGCPRIQLYTRFDEAVPDPVRTRMRELVKRRGKSEPVAYLVGHREFYSLDFLMTPDVLIPRPDTETLVMETLALIRDLPAPTILELGTGSGCISVALAVNHGGATIAAVDISEPALEVARTNAVKHDVADRVRFLYGNLFAPLEPGDRFDVIVSNPPYIPSVQIETLDADVRLHEPHLALDGGADGLEIVRTIIKEASSHLNPDGHLLIEISPEQADATVDLFKNTGSFGTVQTHKDTTDRARVICGRRTG